MGSAHIPIADNATTRSLRLLAAIAQAEQPQSLADLVQALGLPKATLHRLCSQLVDAGFLARDVESPVFAPGAQLRRLAFDTLNHGSVQALRHEILVELVNQIGETCNFTTADGVHIVYLDRVEAPWPWRLKLEVGTRVPLHCTASGKLLLAFMPEAKRALLIKQLPLQAMTDHTQTSAEALNEECLKICTADHAFDHQEFIEGLTAVAVPVRDENGNVRSALAVHAPTARLSATKAQEFLPAMHAAAKQMGTLI